VFRIFIVFFYFSAIWLVRLLINKLLLLLIRALSYRPNDVIGRVNKVDLV